MTSVSDQELERLWRGGESFLVEFKESLQEDAIRESVCAFANDLPGLLRPGFVLVGIRNNGENAGLPITDVLLRTLTDMKTDGNILPPPSLHVEKRVLGGGEVAVVTVEPSTSPPVKCRGRTFVRSGPRRGIATTQDEQILNERRLSGHIPFDLQPMPTATWKDLNLSHFENDYLPRAIAPEILEANERTREEQLTATKMIVSAEKPVATVLGLLVLGSRPSDFLPGAYVQFLRIRGTVLTDDVIDDEEIHGTVAEVLRRLEEKLGSHNHTGVDFTSESLEQRSPLFPLTALQQLVRNAVLHRSYESTSPVRVTWYDDRIEVISPGGPFGDVTAANLGQANITAYRNMNLAEALKVLGFVQRFGAGIPLARRFLQEAGHPPPEFQGVENHVMVTVYGRRNAP